PWRAVQRCSFPLSVPVYCPPRALHSFPTRRSSDLRGALEDTIDCVMLGYFLGRGKRAELGVGALLVGVYDKDADEFVTVTKIGTDRKSTRLNSSHVSSSYAVFCLKKKTNGIFPLYV